jgi:aerobic carbon-monoxide dehydrogenase medium subunit
MFVKPFRYERAESLPVACELLAAQDGYAKILAGGQSLMPLMNLGLLELDAVIDVGHLSDERTVDVDDGYLTIGALARHADLVRDPALGQHQPLIPAAAGWIGSPRIRSRGTLGGSLVHSDPAAELPLVMVTVGADYTLTTSRTTRTVRADEFHVSYFTSAVADDEVLTSVRVPMLGPGWGWGFAEVARRRGDFALAAAAALVRIADGRVVESRVGLGGVNERPMRVGPVEVALSGATREEVPDLVGPIAGIEPVSDTLASAEQRARLARVVTIRAVADAIERGEAA